MSCTESWITMTVFIQILLGLLVSLSGLFLYFFGKVYFEGLDWTGSMIMIYIIIGIGALLILFAFCGLFRKSNFML